MSAVSRLQDLALSESGFVFDPSSGATYTANRTGLLIIYALREGLSRAAVVARLRQSFRCPGADLESDVGEFSRLLVQQGLLPPDFSLEGEAPAQLTPATQSAPIAAPEERS